MIPYNNALYRDNRKAVWDRRQPDHAPRQAPTASRPTWRRMKKFWDDGKLAIMHGVGYLDSPRSHFRSMDIWHTCEPDKVGTEGWLGRVVREFDPKKENVVTAVSFGPSLFRAAVRARRSGGVRGRPAGAVRLPAAGIQDQQQRLEMLERFARMYQPSDGQRR